MDCERRNLIALIVLVLTLPLLLAMVFKHSPEEEAEARMAKAFANSVLREHKDIFDKLAEM